MKPRVGVALLAGNWRVDIRLTLAGQDGAENEALASHWRALISERVAPGVVYTTFHHPDTQVNVVTTEFSDWATNCPEYKVTAVEVMPSNGPSEWQEEYEELSRRARRIAEPLIAAE